MDGITPLSDGDKARAIGRLFDQGREQDAYNAMKFMLLMHERQWPEWLNEVCASVDALTMKEAA